MPTGKLTKESAYHEGMLQYFNEALLERKVINEADYRAMQIKIRSAYTPSVKKKKYDRGALRRCASVFFVFFCNAA